MDADRRRKTVIAGTFAIRRKSLSNAQPISADRSQRIKAEMTMASMHVPTLHKACADGHLRACSLKTFSTLGRKDAPGRQRSADGWSDGVGVDLGIPITKTRRESFEFEAGAGATHTRPTPETSRLFLIFAPKIRENFDV
jgi:hypothetical protein